ncbi:MAG: hypothetical protein PHV37_08320 [Candidatus Gastranaerophilales bacterium]|nr:hypothetical protein [Candidatus Gastranaerophilales bacterium]
MASIIDSIKTISGDDHPYYKITILSLLLFFVVELNKTGSLSPTGTLVLNLVAGFYFIGYLFSIVHNTLSEQHVLMPGFMTPINDILHGALGIVAILPTAFLTYWCITKLMPFLIYIPSVNWIILIITFSVLFSFVMMQALFYARDYKFFNAFNLPLMLKVGGDFIVNSMLLALFLVILSAIILLPLGYVVWLLFGTGIVMNFFITAASFYLLVISLQYYCQMYFEFVMLEYEEKTKNEVDKRF